MHQSFVQQNNSSSTATKKMSILTDSNNSGKWQSLQQNQRTSIHTHCFEGTPEMPSTNTTAAPHMLTAVLKSGDLGIQCFRKNFQRTTSSLKGGRGFMACCVKRRRTSSPWKQASPLLPRSTPERSTRNVCTKPEKKVWTSDEACARFNTRGLKSTNHQGLFLVSK